MSNFLFKCDDCQKKCEKLRRVGDAWKCSDCAEGKKKKKVAEEIPGLPGWFGPFFPKPTP